MFRSYLKTALRNLVKYRTHSLINVIGLSLGIGGSLVLLLYLKYQTQFEKHLAEADRTYLVYASATNKGERGFSEGTPLTAYPLIREGYTDAEVVSLLINEQGNVLGYNRLGKDESYDINGGFIGVDSLFDKVFPLDYLAGTFDAFTKDSDGVMVSRKAAETMFGTVAEALGQTVMVGMEEPATIVAIFENLPDATDFPFHVLFSTKKRDLSYASWNSISSNHLTVVKLREGADETAFKKYLWELPSSAMEVNSKDRRLHGEVLTNLHHNLEVDGIYHEPIPRTQIYTLSAIAVLLILIACVNFVNMASALASQRAREVGVRKVLGSQHSQLMGQFMMEAVIITLTAIIVGLGLAELTLIGLDEQLGADLRLRHMPLGELVVWLLGIWVLVSLISGVYPSLVMARFRPIQALKQSHLRMGGGQLNFGRSLVVLQFFISQIFIIATLVVIAQVHYGKTKDMGYATVGRYYTYLATNSSDEMIRFRDRILTLPGVVNAALSQQGAATFSSWSTYMEWESDFVEMDILIWDDRYQEMYEIDQLAGTPLVKEDSVTTVLINEKLMGELGFTDPDEAIGTRLPLSYFHGNPVQVRGVVKDFQLMSVHEEIPAMAIAYQERSYRVINFQLAGDNHLASLTAIGKAYEEAFPGYAFDKNGIDETLDYFYAEEERLGQLFQLFAGLAILIGCLGLYGLANFMVSRKRKEIGVRKVLGASIGQILWRFSREYVVLILVGFGLAVPTTYFLMEQWLASFAYSVPLYWYLFAGGLVVALLVALIAVGYRSLRAAQANPIKSLRYE
ncbi:MAG: FtsX-like permease family protein [Bacteroidota bacterium]